MMPAASRSQREITSARQNTLLLWLYSLLFFLIAVAQILVVTYAHPLLALTGVAGMALVAGAATAHLGFLAALVVVPTYLFRNPIYFYTMAYTSGEIDYGTHRLWLAIPDVTLVFIVLVLTVSIFAIRIKKAVVARLSLVYTLLVLLLVGLLTTNAAAESSFAYFRSFSIPLIILAVGMFSKPQPLRTAGSFLLANMGIAFFLGGLLYLVNDSSTWAAVGTPYFLFKHGGPITGLPGIWQTTFFDVRLLRFGGTLLDPIAFGYWCVAAVALSCIFRRPFLAIVFTIGVVLSLGKGAYIAVGIVLLSWLWSQSFKRADIRLLAVLASITLVGGITLLANEGKGSFWVHLEGAVNGVRSAVVSPLGAGLGSGGNWGGILSGRTLLSTGAESGLGVIGYQLGLSGLLVVLLWFVNTWKSIGTSYPPQAESKNMRYIGRGVLLGLLVLLFFQENALSASAAFPLWWLLAVLGASQFQRFER